MSFARSSFDDMARVHTDALLRWAFARNCQSSDAWDLVQDVFERALSARPNVADHEELRRWLFVVMRRRHVDRCRAAAVRQTTDVELDALPLDEPPLLPIWKQIDPELVQAFLPRLPEPLRLAFALQAEGHRLLEIADRLSIPIATVATRLFRARKLLRELIEDSAMYACAE